jgi:hypothetical protein
MKKLLLLFFILSSVLAIYPQQEDSVFVIISDDTVHIWNIAAYENCGCLFRMDVTVSNDTIFVTETDTSSNWAYCMCYFDMCASVTGLQSGTYFVEVFRYMPLFYPDTTFYIGSTSFTFGGSVLIFSSQSYQSGCYDITEVNSIEKHPEEYALGQNHPNPFNSTTWISWQSPVSGRQTLKVYDILGRKVATLLDEYKPAGRYSVEFTIDNEQFSSGVYLYRLQATPSGGQAGSFSAVKKMIYLK